MPSRQVHRREPVWSLPPPTFWRSRRSSLSGIAHSCRRFRTHRVVDRVAAVGAGRSAKFRAYQLRRVRRSDRRGPLAAAWVLFDVRSYRRRTCCSGPSPRRSGLSLSRFLFSRGGRDAPSSPPGSMDDRCSPCKVQSQARADRLRQLFLAARTRLRCRSSCTRSPSRKSANVRSFASVNTAPIRASSAGCTGSATPSELTPAQSVRRVHSACHCSHGRRPSPVALLSRRRSTSTPRLPPRTSARSSWLIGATLDDNIVVWLPHSTRGAHDQGAVPVRL